MLQDHAHLPFSQAKVPWRWSSLESLRDRVYTFIRLYIQERCVSDTKSSIQSCYTPDANVEYLGTKPL